MAKTTAKAMATKTPNTKKRVPKSPIQWQIQLSDEQKRGKELVMSTPYSMILGSAGSGKTLLACQIALDSLASRMYDKIIITRPTVATEQNGFLPGTEAEKMEPWLVPIR
ncbi:MAG: PhoH family protein, partial [Waterburya sp.]